MEDWHYRPAADQALPPGESLRSLRREAGLVAYLAQGGWRALTRSYLRLYHRFTVHGAEHLPARPPFVLIGNHTSHLDAVTLAAALPWRLRSSAFPIAAGDVFFETPAASLFSAMMLNALPMWRKRCGSHAMQELRDRLLGDPAIYILFPEGTRSRDGKMGPFKPGLGMLVAGAEVPVVPCFLDGAFHACPPGSSLPRPKPLKLRIGAPLTFAAVPNQRDGWRSIAEQAEQAVQALATATASPAAHR
jgi:1-acyl-sn-glycerol-3-phosphate acyltransferase